MPRRTRRWIKGIALVGLALVGLLVIATVIFVATFDPNDYRQRIGQAVEAATGRTLTITGDLELTFFPWLGVEVGRMSLANAPGFGEAPFAKVDETSIQVALWPLFKGEIQAGQVALKGLELNLIKDQAGRTNWADLIKAKPEPAPRPTEPRPTDPGPEQAPESTPGEPGGPPSQPDPGKPPPQFKIGGVHVEQAAVHWRDLQTNTAYTVAPIELTAGTIAPDEAFPVQLALSLASQQPKLTADMRLEGEATFNLAAQTYRLDGLTLRLETQGEAIPGGRLEAQLKSNIAANLNQGQVSLAPLTLEAADVALTGRVEVTQLKTAPQAAGELASAEFNPRKLLQRLGQTLTTRDPQALNRARLKLAFTATQESARLAPFTVSVDDSTLTGEVSVQSFEAPQIAFQLALDTLNLDRYRPPAAPESQAPAEPSPPPATASLATTPSAMAPPPAADLPVESLRTLNLNGTVKAGQLVASNVRLSDLQATIAAKDGRLELAPVKAALYQGRVEGRATADVRPDPPVFGVKTDIQGVELGGLLQDLVGPKAYLRGISSLAFDLTTRGRQVPALRQALGGKINLEVKDGALRDQELARRIELVLALLKRREPAAPGGEVIFNTLTGSANIQQGILSNRDLRLVTPLILATGEGRFDLVALTTDYTLRVGLAGKEPPGRTVPIGIKGPVGHLSYNVDLKALATEEQKQKLEQKKQELEQKLEQKKQEKLKGLEDKLRDRLRF